MKLHFRSQISKRNFSKEAFSLNKDIISSCNKYTMWSWSAQKNVDPVVMDKAKGIYFWDAEGKRYFDFNSGLMCSNIGHNHPKVIEAIKNQVEQLAFAGPNVATRVRAEIGPILARHTPGELNKFFFTLGGAEANENAIKLAKFYTGRNKILTRYRSYHGATHATSILTGDSRRWANETNQMSGVVRVFDPYKYRSILFRDGMGDEEFSALCLKQLEETILFENPESIAAMFVETVTGTNGIIPPPEGYLQGLRKLLSKYGILMVCDEVMCGFGRTGAWFACDHWGVVPDLMTMAKGITSAYLPLGAVAISPDIARHFDEKPFLGGLTYNGHPMCLAAAVATIKVMEEEKIVENANAMGRVLASHLQRMKERHECVGDVRNKGLFGGIELVRNRKTKELFTAPPSSSQPHANPLPAMMKFLKDRGLITYLANHALMCNPPLVITENELSECFSIIDEALTIADQAVDRN